MLADDELCICFHVSYRKVIRYIQRYSIRVPSQVSECFGAGTGCGWCRQQIRKLVVDVQTLPPLEQDLDVWLRERSPSAVAHREGRDQYRLKRENEKLDSEGDSAQGSESSDNPSTSL